MTALLHRTPNRPGERERDGITNPGRTSSLSSSGLGEGGEYVSLWSPKAEGVNVVGCSVPGTEGGRTGDAVGVRSLDDEAMSIASNWTWYNLLKYASTCRHWCPRSEPWGGDVVAPWRY